MVFKDIQKFYTRKRNEKDKKYNLIKDQLIKSFFTAHPPVEIKAKIKEAVETNKNYLPSFSLKYKLRSSLVKVDESNYIELINDDNVTFLFVDIDFHNVEEIQTSEYYYHFKKQLKSEYDFKIEGRTEEGIIKIEFYESYRPFLSKFF